MARLPLLLAGIVLAATTLAVAAPKYTPDPAYADRDAGPGAIDVSAYPADQKGRYDVFAAKCAKCHPLARPINSRISADDWKRYMKRMIRRPNSGINEEQAKEIYEFLKYYSAQMGL